MNGRWVFMLLQHIEQTEGSPGLRRRGAHDMTQPGSREMGVLAVDSGPW